MPNYLTKEEIKQWRGSLEKITLEEYAKRLGKVINEEKETNDMVDMVYKHHSSEVRYVTNEDTTISQNNFKTERISSLAQQSFDREKEINLERDLRKAINKPKTTAKTEKTPAAKTSEIKKPAAKEVKPSVKTKTKTAAKTTTVKPAAQHATIVAQEVEVTFKKNLTPREQAVYEHFLNNKNHIVYAKELAQVLDLPRDYVYKYIKNLRAKMNESALQNADNGGFILKV